MKAKTKQPIDVDVDAGLFEIMSIPAADEPGSQPGSVDHGTKEVNDELSTGPVVRNPREPEPAVPVLTQDGVKQWKKRHGFHVNVVAQAQAGDVNHNDVDFTINVLGENQERDTLTLSASNTLQKSLKWRPPHPWVRHMSKSLGGDNARQEALALWWERLRVCPATFEKGFFQEYMLREPSLRERKRVAVLADVPEGVSKSFWRKTLYKGTSVIFEREGDSLQKGFLDKKASAFYTEFKKRTSVRKKDAEKTKKSVTPYDFRMNGPISEQVNLKGQELADYLHLFVEAQAKDVCRSLRWGDYDNWYAKNGTKAASSPGASTWGDIEAAAPAYPGYKPDYDAIAKGVWENLIVTLPRNKNLFKAKQSVNLNQDVLKTWIKNVDYSKVC